MRQMRGAVVIIAPMEASVVGEIKLSTMEQGANALGQEKNAMGSLTALTAPMRWTAPALRDSSNVFMVMIATTLTCAYLTTSNVIARRTVQMEVMRMDVSTPALWTTSCVRLALFPAHPTTAIVSKIMRCVTAILTVWMAAMRKIASPSVQRGNFCVPMELSMEWFHASWSLKFVIDLQTAWMDLMRATAHTHVSIQMSSCVTRESFLAGHTQDFAFTPMRDAMDLPSAEMVQMRRIVPKPSVATASGCAMMENQLEIHASPWNSDVIDTQTAQMDLMNLAVTTPASTMATSAVTQEH